jgi:trypsin
MDNKFTVRVGSKKADAGGDVIGVAKVINHPRFSLSTLSYDFSIIKLKSDIKLVPGVKEVVALPSENDKTAANTEVFVSGFGLINENAISTDSRLRGIVVPIVDQKVCRRSYPFLLTDQMICAGLSAGGKDSCSG